LADSISEKGAKLVGKLTRPIDERANIEMRKTAITERLAGTGGAKWDVHFRGRKLAEAGQDIIELSIGEPDVPPPDDLIQRAIQ